MSTEIKLPLSITAGCLCASIRYTVTFPATAPFPPERSSTCQCTQCRKFTGSLLPQGITIPTSYISPPLTSFQTFTSYQSSPQSYRSFCSKCGSSIAFYDGIVGGEQPDKTEIFIGSLDEDVLCGKKAGDGKREGGENGAMLVKARYHCWLENAVPGVTDQLDGPSYFQNPPHREN